MTAAIHVDGMAGFQQRFRFPPNAHFGKRIVVQDDHAVPGLFYTFSHFYLNNCD
jgi:hypothetical protein